MKHARWAILTLAVIGGALAGFSFDQGQKTQVERVAALSASRCIAFPSARG